MATHVVLVHPEIHWNTGNAGRTCLAAGATLHLIEPLGFSLDEREVKRAGLDYWEHVDVRVWPSWDAFERELPTLGEPYFFTTKASRVFWDAPLGAPDGVVLVFGRETGGLPPVLHERYRDRLVAMPILSPRVRSLNLSTSVALANAGGLSAKLAEIVKLCPAHASPLYDVDVINDSCVKRENPLNTDSETGFAHSNCLSCTAVFASNNDAFKRL